MECKCIAEYVEYNIDDSFNKRVDIPNGALFYKVGEIYNFEDVDGNFWGRYYVVMNDGVKTVMGNRKFKKHFKPIYKEEL